MQLMKVSKSIVKVFWLQQFLAPSSLEVLKKYTVHSYFLSLAYLFDFWAIQFWNEK